MRVRVEGQEAYRTTASFTYKPKANLLSVEPTSGSREGGTIVTLTGQRLPEVRML